MPETTLEPASLARTVALDVADVPEQVGGFVEAIDLGDNVTDFRFVCGIKGYEGWQWSVTLYHDVELDRWTVNESSLIPTKDALRPPAWIPWKDRLEPTDLSVTDSIGTDPDDARLERGVDENTSVDGTTPVDMTELPATAAGSAASDAVADTSEHQAENTPADGLDDLGKTPAAPTGETADQPTGEQADGPTDGREHDAAVSSVDDTAETSSADVADAVNEFDLSRRHVLSSLGRAQTAKRWYEGPRGPKSLSTKTADGNVCANCGFLVPLKGELGTLFGVCANKWSPDDGRVVSLDHGCGEHSEIEPPEPSHLWVQSKPAYDNLHIDVIAQSPREDRGIVDLIERLHDAGITVAKGVIVLKSQLPMAVR